MASYLYRPSTPERSVSPLGQSRFEHEWNPTIGEQPSISEMSVATSIASAQHSPATTTASTDPYAETNTKRSIASTNGTSVTAATSTMYHGKETSRPSTGGMSSVPTELMDADWFTRFPCEPELAIDGGDECPDGATLAAVSNMLVYDGDGKARTFSSLYDPLHTPHQRQLIIFVRHFYCGACQAYLQAITDGISMREYFSMPTPTSIIVIGCGQPEMIKHYKTFTNNFPWLIYTDPTRELFKKLGMRLSLNIGASRPEYMKGISTLAWVKGQHETIKRSLRDPEGIRKKDVLKGGNPMQIGGEMLFEEGSVIWCHRMKNYRNHVEVSVLRRLLEIDD